MTAIEQMVERYEREIEEKANKISKLENEIEELTCWINKVAWSRHRTMDECDLPVPRLEIRLTVEEYCHRWMYTMVYRHITGQIYAVPMGETEQKGSHAHFRLETKEDALRELPYRDGTDIRYDAAQLKLPAFAVWGDRHWELDPINP